jgi:hypothetical protein
MELHVFLAVLGAAMMHAGWNAVVKGRDRSIRIGQPGLAVLGRDRASLLAAR